MEDSGQSQASGVPSMIESAGFLDASEAQRGVESFLAKVDKMIDEKKKEGGPLKPMCQELEETIEELRAVKKDGRWNLSVKTSYLNRSNKLYSNWLCSNRKIKMKIKVSALPLIFPPPLHSRPRFFFLCRDASALETFCPWLLIPSHEFF